jgi:RNA polymerase sigma-70 factor (ECF subfamily)
MPEPTDDEFTWLFRTEYPGVVRSIWLVLRDRGRAEEIAQDAFATLYSHWRTVAAYDRPDAWVRRVAMRDAIHAATRERRRPLLERRAAPGDEVTGSPRDPDLAAAIADLPAMQRACVVLSYYEDRPTAEVAHILRIAESTARVHLTRARRALAERLREEVDDDAR